MDKTALITGSARRIGAVIALCLHQAGFKVVIHYHKSGEEAYALAESLNQTRSNSALLVQQDLCAENASLNIIKSVTAWSGCLDVLVNNASLFLATSAQNPAENWSLLFDTNVKAPFLLSHVAYPLLEKSQGCIINITDIHAKTPLQGYALYCQTKAALNLQTKALAKEFAPKIRVNAIAPGAVFWPEHENALSKKTKEKIIKKTPLQRHGQPENIAQAVLALIENNFITGQILAVDGGRSV